MTAIAADLGPPAPWMVDGACLQEDPELFFPISEKGAGQGQIRQARAVCADCPVKSHCLRYALINGIADGIWGGRTAQERSALLRARRVDRARLRPPDRRP